MKKVLYVVLVAAILGIGWYLFVKPYDYRVAFKVKTSPGSVHQEILDFGTLNINLNNEASELFKSVTQQLKRSDSTIQIIWKVKALNDSVSKVTVDLTDKENSLANRFAVPFKNSAIEKIARNIIVPFKYSFDQKLTGYKVSIEGEATTEEAFCACIALKSSQKGKAYSMMSNNFVVDNFLSKNNMKITGPPFLKIKTWQLEKKGLEFNFCFPTNKIDSLPKNKEVFFTTVPSQKAIKAIYYGNYKTSDRAWYALYDYAKRNNIAIKNQPMEVFLNNPNTGGSGRDWKAEVYMPLSE